MLFVWQHDIFLWSIVPSIDFLGEFGCFIELSLLQVAVYIFFYFYMPPFENKFTYQNFKKNEKRGKGENLL